VVGTKSSPSVRRLTGTSHPGPVVIKEGTPIHGEAVFEAHVAPCACLPATPSDSVASQFDDVAASLPRHMAA